MAAAGVDVSALIEQVIDHDEPSPIRSFPQQGAAVRTDAADPRWLLRQYGLDCWEVAAPGGCDCDLEKITGFSFADLNIAFYCLHSVTPTRRSSFSALKKSLTTSFFLLEKLLLLRGTCVSLEKY